MVWAAAAADCTVDMSNRASSPGVESKRDVWRSRCTAPPTEERHCCTATAAAGYGFAGTVEEVCTAGIDRNWAVGSSSPRHVLIHA